MTSQKDYFHKMVIIHFQKQIDNIDKLERLPKKHRGVEMSILLMRYQLPK